MHETDSSVIPVADSDSRSDKLRLWKRSRSAPNVTQRLKHNTSFAADVESPSQCNSLQQHGHAAATYAAEEECSSPRSPKPTGVQLARPGPQGVNGSKTPPCKSADGGVSYGEDELELLEISESCCQPVAADSPLAVINCHMLQFLAQQGRQHARTDCTLLKQSSGKGRGLDERQAKPSITQPITKLADTSGEVSQRQEKQAGDFGDSRAAAASLPQLKGKACAYMMQAPSCMSSLAFEGHTWLLLHCAQRHVQYKPWLCSMAALWQQTAPSVPKIFHFEPMVAH